MQCVQKRTMQVKAGSASARGAVGHRGHPHPETHQGERWREELLHLDPLRSGRSASVSSLLVLPLHCSCNQTVLFCLSGSLCKGTTAFIHSSAIKPLNESELVVAFTGTAGVGKWKALSTPRKWAVLAEIIKESMFCREQHDGVSLCRGAPGALQRACRQRRCRLQWKGGKPWLAVGRLDILLCCETAACLAFVAPQHRLEHLV